MMILERLLIAVTGFSLVLDNSLKDRLPTFVVSKA